MTSLTSASRESILFGKMLTDTGTTLQQRASYGKIGHRNGVCLRKQPMKCYNPFTQAEGPTFWELESRWVQFKHNEIFALALQLFITATSEHK